MVLQHSIIHVTADQINGREVILTISNTRERQDQLMKGGKGTHRMHCAHSEERGRSRGKDTSLRYKFVALLLSDSCKRLTFRCRVRRRKMWHFNDAMCHASRLLDGI
jgi:hypothetical protein